MKAPRSKNVLGTFVPIRWIEQGTMCVQQGRRQSYRGILSIESLDYQLLSSAEQGALIAGFQRVLNGQQAPIHLLIRTLPYDLPTLLQNTAQQSEDYIHFLQQLASKRTLVKRFFYIILSEEPHTQSRASSLQAHSTLQHRLEALSQQLSQLGLHAQQLDTPEVIHLLRSSLAVLEPPLPTGLPENVGRPMHSFNAPEEPQTSPSAPFLSSSPAVTIRRRHRPHVPPTRLSQGSYAELLAPASVQIMPSALHLTTETTQEYLRTLVCVQYPHRVQPGWINHLVQLDLPYVELSLYIEPLDVTSVQRHLARQALEFRGSMLFAKKQERTPDPLTTHALHEVETLRDQLLTGDERAFALSLFLLVRGASTLQALNERTMHLQHILRSLEIRALPLQYQQHTGWLCCLPSGENLLPRYSRMLSTSAASTFFPFTSTSPLMEQGVLFGLHPHGQLITINPFDPALPNANLSVFGQSGRGKSFFLKVVLKRLAASHRIFILDPEGEYAHWARQQQAQQISLSAHSLQINPFDLPAIPLGASSLEERMLLLQEKLSQLMTLFELLIGEHHHLSQKEKAVLYRCLLQTYDQSASPSLHTMVPLLQHHSPLGEELAERLIASLHLFPEHTALTLHPQQHVVFDLQLVPNVLKSVATFLITEFLWSALRLQRRQWDHGKQGIPTILLLDEAWFLLENPEGAQFLAECARRIRKHGAGLWLGTHRTGDFLQSEQGKTLLALCATRLLFQHAPSNLQEVAETFRLSPGQQRFLQTARTGEALLLLNTSVTQLEIVASPEEHTMANTTLLSNAAITERNRHA